MTLTELRYIIAVARECHFGKAAERCHVSQPTLSVAVRKLEDELGLQIFERARGEVRVTRDGEEVVRRATQIVEAADALKAFARHQLDPLQGTLRLGAIFTVAPYLLPHLVPELKQKAPNMTLRLDEDYTANLRAKLRQGELDAIIVARPFEEPDCTIVDLYDEPFVAVLPRAHPMAKRETLRLDDLASANLMLLGPGHCFRDQILAFCPECQKAAANGLDEIIQGSSLSTLRQMVMSGMGVTVLPATAAYPSATEKDLLAFRPFREPVPKRRVCLAYRSSFARPEALHLLARCVRSLPVKGMEACPLEHDAVDV
jgi:LysR family hydrogen peroxide-inducible transcriptional activator